MSTKKSNKKPTVKPTKRDDLLKAKAPKKKVSKKKIVKETPQFNAAAAAAAATTSSPQTFKETFPAFLRPAFENCCDDHDSNKTECVEQHTLLQRVVRSVKGFISSLITAIKHSA